MKTRQDNELMKALHGLWQMYNKQEVPLELSFWNRVLYFIHRFVMSDYYVSTSVALIAVAAIFCPPLNYKGGLGLKSDALLNLSVMLLILSLVLLMPISLLWCQFSKQRLLHKQIEIWCENWSKVARETDNLIIFTRIDEAHKILLQKAKEKVVRDRGFYKEGLPWKTQNPSFDDLFDSAKPFGRARLKHNEYFTIGEVELGADSYSI